MNAEIIVAAVGSFVVGGVVGFYVDKFMPKEKAVVASVDAGVVQAKAEMAAVVADVKKVV